MQRLRAAWTPWMAVLFILVAVLAAQAFKETGATQLEKRAEQVLSQVEGAGKVSVVIYLRSTPQQNQGVGIRNQEQEKIPYGAVAVAQGAEDPFVCAQLNQALCALLGLPASSVNVISGR